MAHPPFIGPVIPVTVEFDGPLFSPDRDATVRQNIRSMILGLSREGAADVQQHYPTYTGHGRAGVRPYLKPSDELAGGVFQSWIYFWASKPQATYKGGKTERRYHMWRRATERVMNMDWSGVNITAGLE